MVSFSQHPPLPPAKGPTLLRRASSRFLRGILGGAAVAWLFCATLAGGAETRPRVFDISADTAETALKRFAAQASLEVLLATEVARGVRTNAIKGEYAPLDAVNRMLANTRLTATQVESTGAIVVGHKEGASPSDASNSNSDLDPSAKKKRKHP